MIPGRVDIIIPCFNMETYVRQCIESALAQTYRNTRVIITNDGSTDYSRRVIQETIDAYMREDNDKRDPCMKEIEQIGIFYEQERKKIWDRCMPDEPNLNMTDDGSDYTREQGQRRAIFLSEVTRLGFNDSDKWKIKDKYYPNGERIPPVVVDQSNKGLSEARNAAILAGDGEFVLPLDADDWIDKDFLELAIPLMADPKVGIVAPVMQYEGLLHNRIPPRGLSLAHEMHSNDLPVCSLYRRECFNQTKRGYETIFVEISGNTRVLGYEDYCFWLDILKRGWNVAVLDKPVFHYRVRAGSMISQAKTKHEGLMRLVRLLHPDLWPNG